MTPDKTSLSTVAALMMALCAGSAAAQQQPDPDCKLPANLRLAAQSTAVYECGYGIGGDPNCNKIVVKVLPAIGGGCTAELPYGKLIVHTQGTARKVTWTLSDTTGAYGFGDPNGIDIANPGGLYHTPTRDSSKSKFSWKTTGKATPGQGLQHCPFVYLRGQSKPCLAVDPLIVNSE